MTASITAVRALMRDTRVILDGLDAEDWALDSGCHGWRVQDLVAHLAFFLHTIAEPRLPLPPNPLGTIESLNDAAVIERADWSPSQTYEYYNTQAERGLQALEAQQSEPLASKSIRLGELGSYRLAQFADAVAFDHLVHVTCDLLAPYGPVTGRVDIAESIDPAINWMLAGLPQMRTASMLLVLRDDPVGVRIVGETERGFTLSRVGENVTLTETADLPPDTATTRAADFLRWATKRSAWRPVVTIDGRRERVSPILDALQVI